MIPIAAVLVVAAAFVCYIPAFQADFVHDDVDLIVGNALVTSGKFLEGEGSIGEIFSTGLFRGASGATSYYRPLMILLFKTEAGIFGLDPFWFHLVNVALHAAAGLVLLLILCRLGVALPAAALGVFLFVVHPANTESVAWISAGANGFAFLLMGLSFLSLLRFLEKGTDRVLDWNLWLAGLFWLAAIMTKEAALVLPVLAALVVTAGPRPGSRGEPGEPEAGDREREAVPGRKRFGRLVVILPFLLAIAVYLPLRMAALSGDAAEELFFGRGTLWERFLTFCGVLPDYLALLFRPVAQNIARPVELSTSFLDPTVIVGAVVLALAAVLVAVSWRRGKNAMLVGASLFLLSFLAVANLVPIPYSFSEMDFPFFERYLYLPSAGLAMIVAVAADFVLRPDFSRRKLSALLLAALTVGIAFPLGIRTFERCRDWRDDEVLFKSALSLYPSSPSLNLNFGVSQQRRGRHREAIAAFHKTINLDPEMWMARFNEAISLFEIGREKSRKTARASEPIPFKEIEEIAEAEAIVLELLESRPFNETLLFEMGRMLEERGQLMGALHLYAAACCLARKDALCWQSLDRVVNKLKYWAEQQYLDEEFDSVMDLTGRIVQMIPNVAWAYEVRGMIQIQKGEREAAVESLERAVKFSVDSVWAGRTLAAIYRDQGDEMKALAMDLYVRKALEGIDLEGASGQ